MNSRFLAYYEQELDHLRSVAGEFALQFPKIAGRLALDPKDSGITCKDPYVERLLEGFAFMAARVQLKLDSEFPRFTQNLLNVIYPQYLCPTPSMAMVQFSPVPTEAGLVQGYTIPRGTTLRGRPMDRTAPCEFRSAHEVKLWPLKINDAQYYTRDLGVLELPEGLRGVRAAVRIRLSATAGLTWDKVTMDELPLFIKGSDSTRMRIYEQLFGSASNVIVRPAPEAGMSFRGLPWQRVLVPRRSIAKALTSGSLCCPPTRGRSRATD